MGVTQKTVKKTYEAFLAGKGLARRTLTPAELVEAALEFYRSTRVEGCNPRDDGDMLLFQWGTYGGEDGEHFTLDVTRQLTFEDADGGQEMWQLSHELHLVPSAELKRLKSGNLWCATPSLANIKRFRADIHETPVFTALAEQPARMRLRFEGV